MAIGHQSFYQSQLTTGISDTDLIIPLDTVPTPSEGFLVIEGDVEAKREIIYYTSKDGTSVTVPAGAGNGRGYDGTTAVEHLQGAAVVMAPVGAMFEKLGDVSVGIVSEATVDAGVTVDGVLIKDGLIQHTGAVQQQVSSLSSAVATGTTVIPYDDTIPQNTEGDQYLSLAITPKSTTNILVIEVVLMIASSVANNFTIALFQDSTANALAAIGGNNYGTTAAGPVTLKHTMAAGTVSATTFKVRAGGSNAGTTTVNGLSAGRKYGGVGAISSITITEYKAS